VNLHCYRSADFDFCTASQLLPQIKKVSNGELFGNVGTGAFRLHALPISQSVMSEKQKEDIKVADIEKLTYQKKQTCLRYYLPICCLVQ